MWSYLGCKEKISLGLRKNHEMACEYKQTINCLYSDIEGECCPWRGMGYDLPDHLVNFHHVAEL